MDHIRRIIEHNKDPSFRFIRPELYPPFSDDDIA